MKIIQFVHPMFLAALGLHASLMLIPIGGDSEPELLEEDVPLAELTGDASRAVNAPPALNKLPVPDPNVAIAQTKPRPRPSPRRVAPPPSRAAAPAQISANSVVAASGAVNNNSSNGVSPSSTAVTTPTVQATPEPPVSFIPNFSQGSSEETESSSEATSSASSNANEGEAVIPGKSRRLSELIASLPDQTGVASSLRASVLALAEALVYEAEGTENETAAQIREAWISSVSRQANGADSIETVEPTVISDFELAYPMASSVVREGRSLDVCLDKEPSKAEIGLLFNAQGELTAEPEILRSTGYQALNLELISMLKETENFPSDRASKAYIYEIAVDYDAEKCIALSELKD